MKSFVNIYIFHALSKRIFIVKWLLTPSSWRLVANLSSVHYWTFNAISNKNVLVNWFPTLHVGGKSPPFLGESAFNDS